MAEGTRAVVLAAATVAMVFADKSGNSGAGNGRAGNGSGNRGSGGATTINQNAAAAEAKTAIMAAVMDVAAPGVAAAVAAKVQQQGQIVATAVIVIP